MKTLMAGLAFLLVAGCANFSGADCSTDAYSLGARDGRLGATPQAELYARRCGVAPNLEQYNAGGEAGRAQRPTPPV